MSRTPVSSHGSSKRGANFHAVYMSIEVLLIECKGCNRRAALTHEELPAIVAIPAAE